MKNFQKRQRIVISFFILSTLLFAYKLADIQIINQEVYAKDALSQYISQTSSNFDRGSIYFTDKKGNEISAATLKSGYRLAIVPKDIEDPEKIYKDLNNIYPLPLSKEEFIQKATKADDPYEEIDTKLPAKTIEKIQNHNIPHLNISKQIWRHYPGENLASQSIGFTAYKEDKLAGRYGLEKFFESNLRRPSSETYVNFFAALFADLQSIFEDKSESEGDIITTIEPNVQSHLLNKLTELKEKWNAKRAGGIVIDPNTGKVIALESVPNFNLNSFQTEDNVSIFKNPLVQNVHEMGSIIKPLIMAIGIDKGEIKSSDSFFDEGKVTVEDYTINNYDKKGRGWVTMSDVLSKSLNTGMVYIATEKLSKQTIRDYFAKFGIGSQTGIELPGELSGLTGNLKSNRQIEFANISFGQGIALTPIQTVTALSTIANGGYKIKPTLISKINLKNNPLDIHYKTPEKEELEKVIKTETSTEVTRMLVRVIDEGVGDKYPELQNYSIAAKTGTAQIPNTEDGGYYQDRNLHSYFGYFPAYDPKFLTFLYIEEPKGATYSSESLSPTFMELTRFLINYYDITPDR